MAHHTVFICALSDITHLPLLADPIASVSTATSWHLDVAELVNKAVWGVGSGLQGSKAGLQHSLRSAPQCCSPEP